MTDSIEREKILLEREQSFPDGSALRILLSATPSAPLALQLRLAHVPRIEPWEPAPALSDPLEQPVFAAIDITGVVNQLLERMIGGLFAEQFAVLEAQATSEGASAEVIAEMRRAAIELLQDQARSHLAHAWQSLKVLP